MGGCGPQDPSAKSLMPTSPASDALRFEYGPNMCDILSNVTVVFATRGGVGWLLDLLAGLVYSLGDKFCADAVTVHAAKGGVA